MTAAPALPPRRRAALRDRAVMAVDTLLQEGAHVPLYTIRPAGTVGLIALRLSTARWVMFSSRR
ncbi:hypothetical protein ACFSHQ_24435 [Gemmobacter lanyuensis]